MNDGFFFFPTQVLTGQIGIICQGEYSLAQGVSLGEGGLYFHSAHRKFTTGQRVVTTFRIPHFLNFKDEFFTQQGSIAFVDAMKSTPASFQRLSGFKTSVSRPQQPLILFSEISPNLKKKIRSYLVSKDELFR